VLPLLLGGHQSTHANKIFYLGYTLLMQNAAYRFLIPYSQVVYLRR